eukprot:SAG22_NODE_11158_length_497_cov_215.520101_2_plen_77_part_01
MLSLLSVREGFKLPVLPCRLALCSGSVPATFLSRMTAFFAAVSASATIAGVETLSCKVQQVRAGSSPYLGSAGGRMG